MFVCGGSFFFRNVSLCFALPPFTEELCDEISVRMLLLRFQSGIDTRSHKHTHQAHTSIPRKSRPIFQVVLRIKKMRGNRYRHIDRYKVGIYVRGRI